MKAAFVIPCWRTGNSKARGIFSKQCAHPYRRGLVVVIPLGEFPKLACQHDCN